uniref:Uncharacterized protein TCIL3000_5_1890 n=1 Tax=Trypanosoma congolense (strain IL3000) TaxID=1068625 RepID=G0UMS6_TRYCI|nr:unnamed protein product [Trypanosoma congolense IL3000]
MTAEHFSPCPVFPGEVEDFYCTDCHTACSALSLLVGPHTGHSRVPLSLAARYFPSSLRRDAHTLLQRLRDEYERPRTEHLSALREAMEHVRRHKSRKLKEFQDIQCELMSLDRELDTLEKRHVSAICHWSRQRNLFPDEVRKLLRGADALTKAAGLNAGPLSPSDREVVKANDALQFSARQVIEKELEEVKHLLRNPLELLDAEKDEAMLHGGPVEDKPRNTPVDHIEQAMHFPFADGARRGDAKGCVDSTPLASDTQAVVHKLLATRSHCPVDPPGNSDQTIVNPDADPDDTLSPGCSVAGWRSAEEHRRWRDDVRRRERLLHEGIEHCLLGCMSR